MEEPNTTKEKSPKNDVSDSEEELKLPRWILAISDFLDDLLIFVIFVLTFVVFFAIKNDLPTFGMSEVLFYIVWIIATFIVVLFLAALIRPLFKIAVVLAILASPFIVYTQFIRKPETNHNVYIRPVEYPADTSKHF